MVEELMASGMDFNTAYETAHQAALQEYGASPYSLYHPDVIQSMPEEFNDAWYQFWGIER